MITETDDDVYQEFQKRIQIELNAVEYTGPTTAQALDLPGDLITSLIELVFGILSGCLGAAKSPKELSERVQKINVIQQMHINNQVRKRIFKNNKRAYIVAGGGKLSDALVQTIIKSTDGEIQKLAEYIKNGTEGLTEYPEL